MDIVSSCGLPVASVAWQSATGAWALTAVCKATFHLVPGMVTPAHAQEPPNEEDNYWNDDESRSLQAASDLVPFKPRADVLVVGHAFAPRGTTVRSLTVRVTVGTMDKTLEARCDRWFEPDGRVREGAPFPKMPLRYERAAGGPDSINPVGMSFDAAPDAYGRIPIANFQPPGAHLAYRGDTFSPVGLGPLAPHWPGRLARLDRRVPRGWHRDWHARPLPEAIDPAYFNAAPPDQQSEPLRPDERILLENLHPDHARLVTRLPGLRPQALVQRATGHLGRMELVADTLWIDTDRALCTVVWRGRIGLTHAREQGTITFTCEGVAGQMHEAAASSAGPLPSELVARLASASADGTMTLSPDLTVASAPAIPFETSPWIRSRLAEASGPPAPAGSEDPGETLFGVLTNAVAAPLPFAPAPVAAEPAPPLAAPTRQSPPLFELHYLPVPSASVQAVNLPVRSEVTAIDTPQIPVSSERPEPPPMLGPLATAAVATASKGAGADASGEAHSADAETGAPKTPGGPKIEDYPLERCARIAARLGCKPDEAAEVLRAEDLDSAGWQVVHEHWLGAVRAKAERRDKTLLAEYDRAYVAELEAQRGAITLEDYARIAEAAERGALAQTLATRHLPDAVWPSIHRAWLARTIKDPVLAKLVRKAMDAQRGTG